MSKEIVLTPNYRPHAKQLLLHNAPISYEDIWVILFGGSRGGGKSSGILADAFMFCQTYPGAKCCILRESLEAVKQSFLDKLPSLFPQVMQNITVYEYKEKSSSWYPSRSVVFPNGSYITFQRVANYKEAEAKQGWEFQYLAIDEVTKQEERSVNLLLACVRSATITNPYTGEPLKIPTKVVYGCNPGGIGHKWVKRKFIDPMVTKYDEHGSPIQTKDIMTLVDDPANPKQKIRVFSRFIPSNVTDNPFLNRSYRANLAMLPEHLKKMHLYGCWDVVAGKMFELKDEQKLPPVLFYSEISQYGDRVEIILSIDWGFKPSYHSAHWHAILPDHRVVTFQELYGQELIFEDFVKKIADMSKDFYISTTCLPHDMFRRGDNYRDDTGRIIGETKADVFENAGLNPVSVESGKGKVGLRYDKIMSATDLINEDGTYKFRITTNCEKLIEELDAAVHDDENPERMAKACADHAIDDYGLFLVYYSDDIEPIGYDKLIKDNRTHLQRLLDEDEELLELEEEDAEIQLDNYL